MISNYTRRVNTCKIQCYRGDRVVHNCDGRLPGMSSKPEPYHHPSVTSSSIIISAKPAIFAVITMSMPPGAELLGAHLRLPVLPHRLPSLSTHQIHSTSTASLLSIGKGDASDAGSRKPYPESRDRIEPVTFRKRNTASHTSRPIGRLLSPAA